MAKDTLTLRLDGAISLPEFAHSIMTLNRLVRALQKETAGGIEIDWQVEDLGKGSVLQTYRGYVEDMANQGAVERVVRGYEAVGRSCAEGAEFPYSRDVAAPAVELTKSLNGKITSLILETEDETFEISRPIRNIDELGKPRGVIDLKAVNARASGYGAITGRIESLSRRGGLRFTLYESASDYPVNCYLKAGMEETMRNAWGKLAVVEGIVRRSPETGRATTIREVANITQLSEDHSGDWRAAIGASPSLPGEVKSEEAIRRLRDAQG